MILRPVAGWPGARGCGLAFAAGVALALGQAPWGLVPLALAGLAGLMVLITRAASAKAAFWLGLFGGAGHFALALSWIVHPFFVDPWRHGWLAPIALPALAFGLALFWAAAAALAWRMPRRMLGLVCLLALAEMLRGYVLTGFPWALIGHVWADTPVAQGAAFAGAYGLTAFTLIVASLPFLWPKPWIGAALALVLVAGGWSAGQVRQSADLPPDRAATVRLVQPHAEQHLKWDEAEAQVNFDRLRALSSALPLPDLILWPETSVPYVVQEGGVVAMAIAEAAQGVPVAAGIQRIEGAQAWNTLALIGPGGTFLQRYDKHHLVPFGEYIPFGDLLADRLGLTAFAARHGNGYSAGPGPRLVDLGGNLGRALPLICYEAVFAQDIRRAPERPDWLMHITNDAWFGTGSGPYQHLAQARLRAIEQGLPLLRAANTGISAVIDAHGQVRQSLALGQRGFLDAPLPGALPTMPPYARWGDVPVLMLLLGGLAFSLLRRRSHATA